MDAFAELGLARDLVIPEEDLRKRFDELSAERHPDAGGSGDGFARLREAHGILKRPAARLRHWLSLEGVDAGGVGVVPEGLVELFGEVGGLLQRGEALERKREGAQSVLVRSLVERETMILLEEIEGLREGLARRVAELEARLPEFQERGVADCGGEALEVAARLAFLERWDAQLQEAWVKNGDW